jgi:hypothetical protein
MWLRAPLVLTRTIDVADTAFFAPLTPCNSEFRSVPTCIPPCPWHCLFRFVLFILRWILVAETSAKTVGEGRHSNTMLTYGCYGVVERVLHFSCVVTHTPLRKRITQTLQINMTKSKIMSCTICTTRCFWEKIIADASFVWSESYNAPIRTKIRSVLHWRRPNPPQQNLLHTVHYVRWWNARTNGQVPPPYEFNLCVPCKEHIEM